MPTPDPTLQWRAELALDAEKKEIDGFLRGSFHARKAAGLARFHRANPVRPEVGEKYTPSDGATERTITGVTDEAVTLDDGSTVPIRHLGRA
jgi:hypothetical protein